MNNEVFIRKSSKAEPEYAGLSVLHLTGVRPTSGEIGIEIEVEGNKFPKGSGHENLEGDRHKIPKKWKYTHDGSLRGQDNAEYVLAKPLKFSEIEGAVQELWQMFSDYGSVLSESNRTSVHVHLNVQDFHINRLCSFVSMYFVLEDLLTSWCGDHRVGNLFCLRAKDAPDIIRKLKEFFRQDGYGYQFSSGMHYAGLNPSAIHKFGSIEIRSLRGVNDPQIILDWVSVLERLYKVSKDFKDPRDVVAGFSGSGPIAWLQNLLGDKYSTIVNNVPYTTDEIRDSLYNGIRFAQDLCYCRDWSEFKEKKFEGDPFGRKKVKSFSTSSESMFTTSISPSDIVWTTVIPSPPSTPTPVPDAETIFNRVNQLKVTGTITTNTFLSLMSMTSGQIYDWLVGAGLWSDTAPGAAEEPDYEEDYDDIDYDED